MAAKKALPQYEFPHAGDVFNLVLETTSDGQRLQREAEAKARDKEAVQQLEQKQQPLLIL